MAIRRELGGFPLVARDLPNICPSIRMTDSCESEKICG
jgi:hypothetical protein